MMREYLRVESSAGAGLGSAHVFSSLVSGLWLVVEVDWWWAGGGVQEMVELSVEL